MAKFEATLHKDVSLGINGELIYHENTQYQDLRIYENSLLGKILTLDGVVQTTTKDEFIYHEMMTHPVLMAHPDPKKVLVIGGGDGGILREVLKHKSVEEAVLVEIDASVVEFSKKYLPSISEGSLDDKRVKIVIEDGAKFVRQTEEKFDIVIVDSPDPISVAKVLFTRNFSENIFNILKKDGLMIRQTGSSFFQPKEMPGQAEILKKIFPKVIPQIACIPTYIGGFFTFVVASKKVNPAKMQEVNVKQKYKKLKLKTKYYNPGIHFAAFSLPTYVGERLK
jgi:spermidine synthase